ncbi:MAG: thiamine diphosphokinase [Actinomycetota bacterium]|nr:thiamine diphosphokinase [Actinomycetota bacterium]
MDTASEVRPEVTVIVVTGGDPPDREAPVLVPEDARVVAADSGADTALSLGLVVDEIVGDLDSVSPAALQALRDSGASVEVHEPDKDATDLELALIAARRHRPSHIVVLGGLGGRIDHELANLLLVSGELVAGVDVVVRSGACSVHVVRPHRRTTICATPGDLVSLMPMHGAARGVTTTGLRWPLTGAVLSLGTTLGLSNELLGPMASVSCTEGVLLAVQPGAVAAPIPPRSTSRPTSEVSDDR